MNYEEVVEIVRQAHKDADVLAVKKNESSDSLTSPMSGSAHKRELACKQIHEKAPRLSEIRNEARSKSGGFLVIVKEMRLQVEVLSVVTNLLSMVDSICKNLLDGYTSGTNSRACVEIRGHSDPNYLWIYGKLSRSRSDYDAVQWLSAQLEPFVNAGTIPETQIDVAHTYAGDKLYVVSIPVFDD